VFNLVQLVFKIHLDKLVQYLTHTNMVEIYIYININISFLLYINTLNHCTIITLLLHFVQTNQTHNIYEVQ
jgi:hypothetical protein